LQIRHGKPTRVRDYWHEGGLNVLSSMVLFNFRLPSDFVPHLLAVRLAMAPAYTRAALENSPAEIAALLADNAHLADKADVYADFDWRLHHLLTRASGNPVYTMILNGFAGFYGRMAVIYFASPKTRAASRSYYRSLLALSRKQDAGRAEELTRRMMRQSIALWHEHVNGRTGGGRK